MSVRTLKMTTYDSWKSRDESREEERVARICNACAAGNHEECDNHWGGADPSTIGPADCECDHESSDDEEE